MHYLVYSMEQLPAADAADTALLDDRERAEHARRGAPYLAQRMLLRRELSRLSGVPVQEVRLSYGENGKPEFAPQPFSISHSGDCLCLAFHHLPIGVDVERMRPRNFAQIAPRFMAPQQCAAFLERGCPMEEFYACWCAAEALVKLAGGTIWHAAQRFPFTCDNGKITPLFSPQPAVELFSPKPGFMGAVAFALSPQPQAHP